MTQIQNTDAINAIRDGAKLSISEGFPTQLSNVCVPVMDMTPHFHHRINIIKTLTRTATSVGVTIYSIPEGRKFYLCGIGISGYIAATSDNTLTSINASIDGTVTAISTLSKLTLNAVSIFVRPIDLFYPVPIVIDGGTNITLTSEFAVGTQSVTAILYGYEIEGNH